MCSGSYFFTRTDQTFNDSLSFFNFQSWRAELRRICHAFFVFHSKMPFIRFFPFRLGVYSAFSSKNTSSSCHVAPLPFRSSSSDDSSGAYPCPTGRIHTVLCQRVCGIKSFRLVYKLPFQFSVRRRMLFAIRVRHHKKSCGQQHRH